MPVPWLPTAGRSASSIAIRRRPAFCRLAKGEHAIAAERMPVERISSVEGWMLKARRLVDEYDIVIVDLPAVVTPAVASAFCWRMSS
ncbi:MAG: hypothetical protein R3D03_01350 [Geminicoccaceae bacterium]